MKLLLTKINSLISLIFIIEKTNIIKLDLFVIFKIIYKLIYKINFDFINKIKLYY